MSVKFVYAGIIFDTLAEAQAQVIVMEGWLENNPTYWIEVKEVSSNGAGGWAVPPVVLTDSEINNLDDTKMYQVASILAGQNLIGLTSGEVTSKVSEYRLNYAEAMKVTTIFRVDTTAPTEVPPRIDEQYLEIQTDIDMSSYL